MKNALAIATLLGFASCSFGPLAGAPHCTEDSQCNSGQICFPDGCGDPGKGLVVEVTSNTRNGQHEQDFAISDGSLRPTYDVELEAPMNLTGGVDRPPPSGTTASPLSSRASRAAFNRPSPTPSAARTRWRSAPGNTASP
jgi:hypothetical protein